MNVLVIIQARMGSTRLPGKVLMPLGDAVVLDYVVSRCRAMQLASGVVVATTVLGQDDAIATWCRQRSVPVFRGPEDDVLARYAACAGEYGADYVVRVTADCPFVDYALADRLIEAATGARAEIARVDGELARGLLAEVVSAEALAKIDRLGREHRHREHVTYYAYEFPDLFQAVWVKAPEALCRPQFRITLDTAEDYAMLSRVANAFYGDRLVAAETVVAFLERHPEVAAINAHVRQKPVV
ncbi:MAG: acylneuraminate cytidylyltransferase [Candidatus Reconcilbacillus cellulovorans]|uniref:Acylneuraminate cytidylyltransferase n=1 Tax=Candidatus Reconcilbacillus cellulovorans TaxID=1906605 RepID=A0A2A6DZ81_9BACL|nr:MAG: acylneuraminate cytidylyltransferase [Candidatus Reconcilbacillus cellulovorans]